MQAINSSNYANSSVKALSDKAPVKNQQAKTATHDEKQASSTKPTTRLDINEQAIALLEQQNANVSGQINLQNKAETSKNAKFDQPSQQNLSAVNTYQRVNNLTQRENIQAMLGVDLFA